MISGTKRTVRNRGVCKERLDCTGLDTPIMDMAKISACSKQISSESSSSINVRYGVSGF